MRFNSNLHRQQWRRYLLNIKKYLNRRWPNLFRSSLKSWLSHIISTSYFKISIFIGWRIHRKSNALLNTWLDKTNLHVWNTVKTLHRCLSIRTDDRWHRRNLVFTIKRIREITSTNNKHIQRILFRVGINRSSTFCWIGLRIRNHNRINNRSRHNKNTLCYLCKTIFVTGLNKVTPSSIS